MVTFEFRDGLDVESLRKGEYYLVYLVSKEGSEVTEIQGVLLYCGQLENGCCGLTPFEKCPDNELMMGEQFYEAFLESETAHLRVTFISQMGRVGCQRPCPSPSENEMMFGVESPGGN